MRLVLAAAFALSPLNATAQEPQPFQGIGFVQAFEGTWLCRHENPADALSCAMEHCAESAPDQTCLPTAWCYPANWSGVVQIHFPDLDVAQVVCGMTNEETLKEVLASICKSHEGSTQCDLTLTVDPEGNERKVEGVTFPGAAAEASTPEPTEPAQ